ISEHEVVLVRFGHARSLLKMASLATNNPLVSARLQYKLPSNMRQDTPTTPLRPHTLTPSPPHAQYPPKSRRHLIINSRNARFVAVEEVTVGAQGHRFQQILVCVVAEGDGKDRRAAVRERLRRAVGAVAEATGVQTVGEHHHGV